MPASMPSHRNPHAFRHGPPSGGSEPITRMHIALAALLLGGIFVVAPLLVLSQGWLDDRDSRVDLATSPRLSIAVAALGDLEACKIEYGRTGPDRRRSRRALDVVFVTPCGEGSALRRYAAPAAWSAVGGTTTPFRLERDARSESWQAHTWDATAEALARALEEVAPALRAPPMSY